jgi:uncharacterized damage-inducible protein DinB
MHVNEQFIAELKEESQKTGKMLERVPEDKFSWKPHDKSKTLGELASHIAEMPYWAIVTLTTHEYDFATANYTPSLAVSKAELMQLFESNLAMAIEELENAEDDIFPVPWTASYAGHVVMEVPRSKALRTMVINHIIHHRGQLSVYLRLLDIPVPNVYGPTADEF